MTEENHLRMMSPKEREIITRMMDDHPLLPKDFTRAIVKDSCESALFLFVIASFIMGLLYFTNSLSTSGILIILGYFFLLDYPIRTILQSKQSIKRWSSIRQLYLDELESGQVTESRYLIADVKTGKYPYSDGVVYFLLLEDSQVFVLYDDKNSTQSPLTSNFVICREFKLVKSKPNDWVLSVLFSGDTVPVTQSFELPDKTESWPEDEEFCNVSWDEIEKRYKRSAAQ